MIRVKAYAQYKVLFGTETIELKVSDILKVSSNDTPRDSLLLREILQFLTIRYPEMERYLPLTDNTSFKNHVLILANELIQSSLESVIPDNTILELYPVFIGG